MEFYKLLEEMFIKKGIYSYPSYFEIRELGILRKWHNEIILRQRWDLSDDSRKTIMFCLN